MKLFGLDKATIDKVCYQNPQGLLQAAGGLRQTRSRTAR